MSSPAADLTRTPGFFDRRRIIAGPEYNRWLVPPAALSIHLAIGEVYAFSVFKLPLTRLIGGAESAPGDWTQPDVAWIFSIAIVFLGVSAALFGKWLEVVGPRKAMFASAACFGSGFLVSALGASLHQIWLLYLGYGVLGGIGLGLGYISPVSTLIKWFPDRPGMATGLAIMGFGGGAMIGSPFATLLMDRFKTTQTPGVAETFAAMGLIYFLFMLFGVLTVRLPPPDWKPAGFVRNRSSSSLAGRSVGADQAIRTPQFWLLWAVLFLNVTAGIGVLEQASPMIQEMFPQRVLAPAAAGFVGLLSLFNMAGRFCWSSLSDVIGRKTTYTIFFLLGAALYASTPQTGGLGTVTLFALGCSLILSMYGGGFATIPAYLRDLFGTEQVGAIHGRLLTAWSMAGVAGPSLVNYVHEYQTHHGVAEVQAYTLIMYLMAALLVIGLVCNQFVRPLRDPHLLAEASDSGRTETNPPPAAGRSMAAYSYEHAANPGSRVNDRPSLLSLLLPWLWVGVPLAWGVSQTVRKSLSLFQ